MNKARYRIDRISAEGFRGFTTPQQVRCDGQNLFIFGMNGRGKSSIVEAIRWCIFGSHSAMEIEVRNTFYEEANCVVALWLSGSQGQLEFTRELRPGMERSRLSIRTAAGEDLRLQDALPQLARIGHEQGTQVIFAAQHAAGRTAQVDITDFTRVLCFYLRLEDALELAKQLGSAVDDHRAEAERLAGDLELAAAKYRSRMEDLQARLSQLLANPPWGEGAAPTGEQTDAKIGDFLEEQARLYGVPMPDAQGKAALYHVRRWMDGSEGKRVETLESQHQAEQARLEQARQQLGRVKAAASSGAAAQADLEEAQKELSEFLGRRTEAELTDELVRCEQSLDESQLRFDIARAADALSKHSQLAACPLCGKSARPNALQKTVAKYLEEGSSLAEEAQRRDELRTTARRVQSIRTSIEELSASLASARGDEDAAKQSLCALFQLDPASCQTEELERQVQRLAMDVETIQRTMAAAATERQQKTRRLKDLEEELSFHRLRDDLAEVEESLTSGLEPVRDILAQYRELLNNTSQIRQCVDDAFDAALERAAPPLNSMMADVFARLTHHPSYDQILISRTQERRRELRVASTRRPGNRYPPTVLNGQAFKALQLVPYFVFSRFQPEIMELDLLLIDDPSESFDTSHVETLIAELAEAARHAQLVVATHEREKFEPHLAKYFADEPYKVVSVDSFDPVGGPSIVCG
jgi:DNA repair exonuclease SbcCD ATPase subunit